MKLPKRKMDWIGLKVRCVHELKNHYGSVPVGTECIVTHSNNGLWLTTIPCVNCGLSLSFTHILERHVEIIDAPLNEEILGYNKNIKMVIDLTDPWHSRRIRAPENSKRPAWIFESN